MQEHSLKVPCLLVAAPTLEDPFFQRAVILITSHNAEGTTGFILNRKIKEFNYKKHRQSTTPDMVDEPTLYLGGPVETDSCYEISLHNKAGSMRVFVGYAGWGPNQLLKEVMKESWLVCNFDPDILEAVNSFDLWEHCLQTLGINHQHFSIPHSSIVDQKPLMQ